ncbi:unnamed protein product [Soboliphyme baturini]|uniref:SH2 domain-containing protein n=1 Tax=Soboliphyme baturini TaxID=241478 RepID=A0A183IP03_9BILA|nr:unnamed protein product [Soboliphyme baturini]
MTTVAIDISGEAFRRMMAARRRGHSLLTPSSASSPSQVVVDQLPEPRTLPHRFAERVNRRRTVADVVSFQGETSLAEDTGWWHHGMPNGKLATANNDMLDCPAANEYLYDFAPFYRRRTKKSLLNNVGQFFSLRHPHNKHKQKSSPPSKYGTNDAFVSEPRDAARKRVTSHSVPSTPSDIPVLVTDSDDVQVSASSSNGGGGGGGGVGSTLRKLLRRSISFRSSSRRLSNNHCTSTSKPVASNDAVMFCTNRNRLSNVAGSFYTDDEYTLNRTDKFEEDGGGTKLFSKASSKTRSKLPISTSSQVFHVATLLRQQPIKRSLKNFNPIHRHSKASSSSRDSAYSSCGKTKMRRPSINSVTSNTSLDFSDRGQNGSYRQGYQLEYPEDCFPYGTVPVHISSPRLLMSVVPSPLFASCQSDHDTTRSNLSSLVASCNTDRNSADNPERFFTSVHCSGDVSNSPTHTKTGSVTPHQQGHDFRGRSFSTHSSSSTVAAEPSNEQMYEKDRSSHVPNGNRTSTDSDCLDKFARLRIADRRSVSDHRNLVGHRSHDGLVTNVGRLDETSSPNDDAHGERMSLQTSKIYEALDASLLSQFFTEISEVRNPSSRSLPSRVMAGCDSSIGSTSLSRKATDCLRYDPVSMRQTCNDHTSRFVTSNAVWFCNS